MEFPDRETCAAYGRRSAKGARDRYSIEGDTVTLAEIAKRVGCSEDVARKRLRKLKALPEPITWESLQNAKQSKARGKR